jgi:hypothetical protein
MMMRFPVRVALGLAALLIAPSIATAQVARDAASASDGQPSRAFKQISFGRTTLGPRAIGTLPPRAMDIMLSNETGGRLPGVTAAPNPHPTPPPCVMRVVPIDPRLDSRILVVSVDERIDPKSVIKRPACQPQP